MNTFRVQIITPHGKVFDNDVSYAVFPGDKGEFGVLQGHSAILSLLAPGVIEVTKLDNSKEGVAIDWGYAEINENSAIVLVDKAVAVAGKTAGEMQLAISRAEELIRSATESSVALATSAQKLRSLGVK